jgi:PPOX class probable F420-dependent enzyme
MVTISEFARTASRDQGLCIVSTLRADSTIQSSLVNAGVLDHPVTGEPVVAHVAYGSSRKLANLRARPQMTIVARAGWEWVGAEGTAELIGPADPREGVDAERLRLLLREIFTAAGGTHDDWDAYDKVMLEEGRTAVLVAPTRIYSNRRSLSEQIASS